jgi:hypothetical protein
MVGTVVLLSWQLWLVGTAGFQGHLADAFIQSDLQ